MRAVQKGRWKAAEALHRAGADLEKKDLLARSVEDHIEDEENREIWRKLRDAWQNGESTE